MGRLKGSKNSVKALVEKVPQQVDMYRKVSSNRTYGLMPFPFPLTMYDCCDYYVCEILPGDGVFNTYVKFGARKVSTEHALMARNLSVRSDQDLLIEFVRDNPERFDDLKRYLPENVKINKKQRLVIEAPKDDLSKLTKRELTEILRETEANENNASYLASVSRLLKKISDDEKNGVN